MSRVEQLEKSNEELNEQMRELMKMMSNLVKEKTTPRASGSGKDDEQNSPPGLEPTGVIAQVSENIKLPPPTVPFYPPPTFVPQSMVLNGHEAINPITIDNDDKGKPDENGKLLSMLDERLKMVEGFSYHKAMNACEATLVPGLVTPPKFKVPEFKKYNGTKCPQDHLLSYVRKMAAHISDDKLMIHFFQDSLTVAASRWYN